MTTSLPLTMLPYQRVAAQVILGSWPRQAGKTFIFDSIASQIRGMNATVVSVDELNTALRKFEVDDGRANQPWRRDHRAGPPPAPPRVKPGQARMRDRRGCWKFVGEPIREEEALPHYGTF